MDLTVKLLKPIELDALTYDALTLRELTVDEQIALEKNSAGRTSTEQDKYFFAHSCGVPPTLIGKLGSRDWLRLKNRFWETLGNVTDDPPQTTA